MTKCNVGLKHFYAILVDSVSEDQETLVTSEVHAEQANKLAVHDCYLRTDGLSGSL